MDSEGGFLEDVGRVLDQHAPDRWKGVPLGWEKPVTEAVAPTSDLQPVPLADRLRKGAEYLAKLWRENVRCASGWSTNCSCLTPNHFCVGKTKWLKLAKEDKREFVQASDAYGVVGMMKVVELEATGLTITVQIPAFGRVTFGPNGDFDVPTLLAAFRDPDGVNSMLKLVQLINKERAAKG